MEKGYTTVSRFIGKSLTPEMRDEIAELVLEGKNIDLSMPDFTKELADYYDRVSIGDGEIIKHYTGFSYVDVNAVLRDKCNYNEHRHVIQRKDEITKYAEKFSELISAFPPTKINFIAYRGTTLGEFSDYGINSLEELKIMKDKYVYEKGFTSTSLTEEDSFYNKNVMGTFRNILIKYIVPANSQDGMPLTKGELSFVESENEYLINKDSLSKILDVEIEGNNAIVTALLIPKALWNKPIKVENKTYD